MAQALRPRSQRPVLHRDSWAEGGISACVRGRQAQVGADLRRRPSLCSLWPLPGPPALPALAGKELTSRLLSVNVELLIPTAKRSARAATGVGGSRQPRERAPARARARTPRARTFLGGQRGRGASFTCPPPTFELRVLILSSGGHPCHPPRAGRTNFLRETAPAARRAGWTGRSRRLDRQMDRRTGHLRACPPGPDSDGQQQSGQPGGLGFHEGQRGALLDLCLPASDL